MTIVQNRKPDRDVFDAIEMSVLCQEFRCLPGPGGLLDQDAYHIWLMDQVSRAQEERRKLDDQRSKKH